MLRRSCEHVSSFLTFCRPAVIGYTADEAPTLPPYCNPPRQRDLQPKPKRRKKMEPTACVECDTPIVPRQQRYIGCYREHVFCNACGLRWRRARAMRLAAEIALKFLLCAVPEAGCYLRKGVLDSGLSSCKAVE